MRNGTLVLKSGNALSNGLLDIDYDSYAKRVRDDGGVIVDVEATIAALKYANLLGIDKDSDVGIGSVRWGVKRSATGKIIRLYSLFNANADIIVSGTSAAGQFEETSDYSFNSLYLGGAAANTITSQAFTFSASLTAMKISKPPLRDTGQQYGAYATIIPQFQVLELSPLRVPVESALEFAFVRSAPSTLPSDWRAKIFHVANPSKSLGEIPITNLAIKATKFSTTAAYLDVSNIVTYTEGVQTSSKANEGKKVFGELYKAELSGRADPSVDISSSVMTSPVVTDFVEVWLVADMSESVAQKLSERAETIYGAL